MKYKKGGEMIKKVLFFVLICIVTLVGCGEKTTVFDIDSSKISTVDIFTGDVPSNAVKKTVTLSEDIVNIVNILNDIEISEKATEEDIVIGGIGYYLVLNYSDGSCQAIHISSNGKVMTFEDLWVKISSKIDGDNLWTSLDYEEIKVGKEGLPEV